MTNILAQWGSGLAGGQSMRLPCAVVAEGLRDRHLGPRSEWARVRVSLKPALALSIQTASTVSIEAQEEGYADAVVLGVLDVLMVSQPYPIREVAISLEMLEVDPINSSRQAFRMAGRDAATKALAQAFG